MYLNERVVYERLRAKAVGAALKAVQTRRARVAWLIGVLSDVSMAPCSGPDEQNIHTDIGDARGEDVVR